MKLTTTIQLSLDGVMQSPGGPDEDDRGFNRGGWAHFDSESGEFVDQVFQRADAFLFGRKTYDIFAYTWGAAPKTSKSPIAAALHTNRNTWCQAPCAIQNGTTQKSYQQISQLQLPICEHRRGVNYKFMAVVSSSVGCSKTV